MMMIAVETRIFDAMGFMVFPGDTLWSYNSASCGAIGSMVRVNVVFWSNLFVLSQLCRPSYRCVSPHTCSIVFRNITVPNGVLYYWIRFRLAYHQQTPAAIHGRAQ